MFKLHNTVRVRCGGKTLTASNEVTGIAAALAQRKKYGAYVLLDGADGVRSQPAEVTEMNCDPRSQPYVTKTATFSGDAYTFDSVGLSPDGIVPVNAAFVGKTVKAEGAQAVVSVTICLEWEKNDASFCGGDNPLVRFLLGEGDLGDFRLASGRNFSPVGEFVRDDGNFFAETQPQVTLDESGITLEAAFASEVYEAVALLDGVPVLRAGLRNANLEAKTGVQKVSASGTLYAGNHIAQIFNLVQNGTIISEYTVTEGLTYAGNPIPLPVKISPNALLVADGDFCLAAAVSEREAALFALQNNEVTLCGQLRIEGDPSFVRLTRDGSLFDFTDNGLRRVFDAGIEAQVYALEKPSAYQVVLDRSGAYHLAALYGRTLKRFKLTKNGAELVESVALIGDNAYFLGKYDGATLSMCGKGNPSKVCTLEGTVSAAEDTLTDLMETFSPQNGKLDGAMTVFTGDDGVAYVINYRDYDGVEGGEDGSEVRFNGEVAFDNQLLYVVDLATSAVYFMPYAYDAAVTDAVRLGNYVLRSKSDGTADCLPLSGQGTCVLSHQFQPRQNVTFNYLMSKRFNEGRGVKVTLQVAF